MKDVNDFVQSCDKEDDKCADGGKKAKTRNISVAKKIKKSHLPDQDTLRDIIPETCGSETTKTTGDIGITRVSKHSVSGTFDNELKLDFAKDRHERCLNYGCFVNSLHDM